MKRFIALICCFMLFINVSSFPTAVAAYSDGYTIIGDVTIPFKEYMPGSFFTKDGTACECHDSSSIDCVANGSACNCLRYVTVDGKKYDLLAVQCIGFARYCFLRLFGFIDHEDINKDKFYNAGTISYGNVTAGSIKELFSKLKPGAHIRFKLAYSQHSVILLSQNADGFTVYQANSGGNGIAGQDCVVSTKTYTWQSFADYAYRGIVFAHMPNNYPDHFEYSDTPTYQGYSTGIYTTTDNLRLRSGPSTDTDSLTVIPKGTVLTVTDIEGVWGKTAYSGYEGWVYLQYAEFNGNGTATDSLIPIEGSGVTVADGYIYGIPPKLGADEFKALFENPELIISTDQRYIGSGCIVTVMEDGVSKGSATVIVKGDINSDGILSSGDCIILKSVLTGNRELDKVQTLSADLDYDGYILTSDYKRLQLQISLQQ